MYRLDEEDDEASASTADAASGAHVNAVVRITNAIKKANSVPKLKLRLAENLPSPKVREVHVILYVIRAFDLHPMDSNGKADPYLVIKMGRHNVVDKANKKHNTINPTFGR